jgi:hypothetical protein
MPSFLLHSQESAHIDAHQWRRLCRAGVEKIIVAIEPPIPGSAYGVSEDVQKALLAPRWAGNSIDPEISTWPFTANLYLPVEGGDWTDGPWRLMDIVQLIRTAEQSVWDQRR